jgi:hypothetical protein
MKQAEDTSCTRLQDVHSDIRCAWNREFAGTLHPARATSQWRAKEALRRLLDRLVNLDRSAQLIGLMNP